MNQIVKFEEKMCRIHNDEWKEDDELKNALSKLIKQGMKQSKILLYMKRDFQIYIWSERTWKENFIQDGGKNKKALSPGLPLQLLQT